MSNEPNGGGGEPANQPNDNSAPFYAGFQDAELRGFVETKGFKTPEDVVKSYRNLESHLGVPPERLLKLPAEQDSPEWSAIKARLGFEVPESPENYELPVTEGLDTDYSKEVAKWLHEAGVPKSMALKLAEKQNAYIESRMKMSVEEANRRAETEISDLKSQWGNKYDASVEIARRASRELMPISGLTQDDLQEMENAIGTAKFLRLWANIGSKTQGEAPAHGNSGDGNQGFGITPDVAKHRIEQLKGDKDWFDRWSRGDAKAVDEWNYLNRVAAGA